jgi:hypothetical protein
LQELPPTHFVVPGCADEPEDIDPESCAIEADAKNSIATAEARIAPFVPLFIGFLPVPQRGNIDCRPSE